MVGKGRIADDDDDYEDDDEEYIILSPVSGSRRLALLRRSVFGRGWGWAADKKKPKQNKKYEKTGERDGQGWKLQWADRCPFSWEKEIESCERFDTKAKPGPYIIYLASYNGA